LRSEVDEERSSKPLAAMKPAPFEHIQAVTVDDAVAALREHGEEARVLAGGQSLVPLMNLRRVRPRALVDINVVGELGRIEANGSLEIGATVRQSEALRSPEVRSLAPLVVDALHYVGHPATRNRGTVGGIVAHADPVAELPPVLLALDAEIMLRGPNGERRIDARDFFTGAFSTAADPAELVGAIRVPRQPRGAGWGFAEVAPRGRAFAIVGAACLVELTGERECREVRIALLGAGDGPVRAAQAEAAMHGRSVDSAVLDEACELAAADLDPPNDFHASGAYRRMVIGALVRRALEAALGRAEAS